MCFVGRRCLLKPLDYVFMSPPAYMPTENNVPIIISCQKQDYGLQILYHALFKIASKGPESLCKPANGHHRLRLVSSSVQSRN